MIGCGRCKDIGRSRGVLWIKFLKKIGEKVVSYDTIYRMINELNPYIHEFIPNNHISSKNSNEIFEIEYFQLDYYILDERDNIESGEILGKLMEMSPKELEWVRQYIDFLFKK